MFLSKKRFWGYRHFKTFKSLQNTLYFQLQLAVHAATGIKSHSKLRSKFANHTCHLPRKKSSIGQAQ